MSDSPEVMMGMSMPDIDHWSERVSVALGQNPTPFTGPGTNTYLIGTGPERILLDTGQGLPEYLPVLERALGETGCTIQEIVLTHGHPDHIGGVAQIRERFGELEVKKILVSPATAFRIGLSDASTTANTKGVLLERSSPATSAAVMASSSSIVPR